MAPERRNRILLAALAVIFVAVVVYQLRARPAVAPPASSNPAAGRNRPSRGAGAARSAPQVDLQTLQAPRPEPMTGERNLFRFKPKPPPAPPPVALGPRPPAAGTEPARPAGPGAPPPINLKFIGILEAPQSGKKIAALSDGRHVYQGVEGGIILGQYRILHIGNESIELAYLDGRGRQTIRLTGG